MRLFHDRIEAGHELARLLAFLRPDEPIVLGLCNGGVPLAEVVAHALEAPLDVLLMDRLSAPKNPEHIVGAVDEHGRISMIKTTARWHHLTSQQMVDPARDAFRALQRRRGLIRSVLPEMDVRNRTVIIVGQGVASGAKMLGAVASVRDRGARKVVVAAPAGSGEAAWQLHEAADLVVIPHRPARFRDVASFYDEFDPFTDEQVISVVERWVKSRPDQQPGIKTLILKLTGSHGQLLCCEIDLPPGTTRGSGPFPAVVFAHGLESDGRSVRNAPIAQRLAERSFITVRPDFTGHGRSEGDGAAVDDAQMASDLGIVLDNVRQLHEVDLERIGLVGSGTGARLVLERAENDAGIRAVVGRGPMRGDEVEQALQVGVPTLLIYSGHDTPFAEACSRLRSRVPSSHELLHIPDAARRFADAISLEMMVGATVDWLVDHLGPIPVSESAEGVAGATDEAGG